MHSILILFRRQGMEEGIISPAAPALAPALSHGLGGEADAIRAQSTHTHHSWKLFCYHSVAVDGKEPLVF